MAAETTIRVRAATKIYGGVHALKGVDFDVKAGEIHGLAGENGAGKSTLCKALAGAIQLTSGTVEVLGQERVFSGPADALKTGIAMVYQESSLVPTMTVAQNMLLGREHFFNKLREGHRQAQAVLRSMGFHVDPTAMCGSLGAAQRQMVEIGRAVLHEAKIIIFDEPTATLTPAEKKHFFRLLRALRERGVSVIYISHALEECLKICARITVLRDGQWIATESSDKLTREILIKHMVGRSVDDTYYAAQMSSRERLLSMKQSHDVLPTVLRVNNLRMGGMVRGMSFSLRAGQITGLAGLIGSGRTETAKVVSGALKRDLVNGGTVHLEGRPVWYRTPRKAAHDGIVYITEDRKINGFFETMSPSENIHVGWLGRFAKPWHLTSRYRERSTTKPWIEQLQIRSLNRSARLVELSGGNQQKVVIAKALIQKPKVVIFDEPTRGVDVGAIQEIHEYIRSLARDGAAVLVISSYLPEVLSLADRILVARAGRISEEMAAAEATQDKIMAAATS